MEKIYYYNGIKLRTSKSQNTYKYALILKRFGKVFVKKMSANIETIDSFYRYLTRGFIARQNGESTKGLWSSQFVNPEELEIVKLEMEVR